LLQRGPSLPKKIDVNGSVSWSKPASGPDGVPWSGAPGWVLGGDVEVIEELGRGAQSIVYRVRRAGVEYALKVLRHVGDGGESALARFRREAALLARVNHSGVPRVFDVGLTDGHPYLVLELIDGQPLSARLRGGPLNEDTLVRLGRDVAAALHAAHGAGLVHRDIKPDNIIVAESGQARLIDFGLAAGRVGTPDDAVVGGTFDYSAPEQTGMLARPIDGRTDLYAMGVLLFQCATGQLPFQADDVGQLLALHAAAPVPDPRAVSPELAGPLAELIVRLMAKDPDDRVQTAQELYTVLSGPAIPRLPATGALSGREDEQTRLTRCWQRARAGHGGVVLIEGPPGVGKSTLARFTAQAARADGALVLVGNCAMDSPLPMAALRTAVDGYLRVVTTLPVGQRAAAIEDLRAAAGADAGLLRPLSPAMAALLDAPRLTAEEPRDQFAAAVASLLCALATRRGGLLLLIDDVQWMDQASRDVLRRLTEEMVDAPLLVIATAGDDETVAQAAAAFAAEAGARLDLRLPVGPLHDDGAARLISSYLAGSTVSREVTAEMTERGRGNPFMILEYLHALVEAGALRPCWGSWQLDSDRLPAIDLPADVFELVLARIDGLGQRDHETLTVAAALGSRFEAGLLAGLVPADPAPALAEAVDRGLLRPASDSYTFVHDRIREALLSTLDPDERRGLHRRIARVLAAQHRTDPADVYALARHFSDGGLDHDADRVFTTGWAAGQLALAENAPEAAVSFLEAAAAGAEAAGIRPDSRFSEALAVAYLSVGDAEAAGAQLEPALAAETAPLRRAALLLQLSHVRRTGWELTAAIDCVRAGLAELGWPLPGTPLRLGLATIRSLLWWLLSGGRRPARRPAVGEKAERVRLHAMLCRAGAATAGYGMRYLLALTLTTRAIRSVHRLGPSTEYATAYGATGILAAGFRLRRRKRRIFRRVFGITSTLADPQMSAFAAWMQAYANYLDNTGTAIEWAEVSERHRRWLEPDHYLNTILMRARDLIARGHVDQALAWVDRGRARVSSSGANEFGVTVAVTEAMARSLLGQEVTRPAILGRLGQPGLEPGYTVQIAVCAAQLAVEQDEPGEPLDAAMDVFDRLRLPLRAIADSRTILVSQAFGRLTRCQRAAVRQRASLLTAATGAVRRLGKAANDPLLRAYHQVARAGLSQLSGEPARALALLAGAEKHLVSLDAPLVHYEAARVRARALRALGADAPARQNADQALALARCHGWARRARWVREEFQTTDMVARRTAEYTRHSDAVDNHYRRRLEALQQVSAAAATVLDPQQLARIALDETLRILGAERAILFLCGEDGQPRPSLGRTATGELTEMTGYSASLVERVAANRTPLVVTGGEQGAALGSQSTVVHGLRSIMIAPLELDGRLLGVVYLDSRVAKGVFTDEDIDILTAVTNQVAVSLETARAAQLEAVLQAARQQRDTAEALRAAMSELSATLDPEQVLHRLRDIVARTLPADRVCLLHRDADELTVATTTERQPDNLSDTLLGLVESRTGGATDSAPAGLAPVLDGVRSWLVTPLVTRGHGIGILVAGSDTAEQFVQAQLDIAAALADHGGTAYANARLFAQVRQLATTDGLTGLLNRRHFAELAPRQLDIAARSLRPLAVLMVDIDHFKKINDTYGHGIGDDVICAVAGALRANARESDVLCRYGGEEFAIVMSEMHGDPEETAERLRLAVASLAVPGPAGPIRATVSIGVAEMKPDDQLDGLLVRADQALYRAKEAGRNQVNCG
jgi:diguanylate cyclase (GGDEF)-like protein